MADIVYELGRVHDGSGGPGQIWRRRPYTCITFVSTTVVARLGTNFTLTRRGDTPTDGNLGGVAEDASKRGETGRGGDIWREVCRCYYSEY